MKPDLRTRRCSISETDKKKVKRGPAQIPPTGKGQNPWDSGPTPFANGGSGAKAPGPPLAERPKRRVLEKIPGQLEVSFLIFLTLGLIKQSNMFHEGSY